VSRQLTLRKSTDKRSLAFEYMENPGPIVVSTVQSVKEMLPSAPKRCEPPPSRKPAPQVAVSAADAGLKRPLDAVPVRNRLLFGGFPMFVPSLSW
jgi:hypothetical protein